MSVSPDSSPLDTGAFVTLPVESEVSDALPVGSAGLETLSFESSSPVVEVLEEVPLEPAAAELDRSTVVAPYRDRRD